MVDPERSVVQKEGRDLVSASASEGYCGSISSAEAPLLNASTMDARRTRVPLTRTTPSSSLNSGGGSVEIFRGTACILSHGSWAILAAFPVRILRVIIWVTNPSKSLKNYPKVPQT